MAGLWIAHVEVTDEEAYGRYIEGATKAIAAHNGRFVARGGRYRQFEGKDHPRNVVVRFDSYDDAVACYESPEYQAIVDTAIGASNRSVVVVEAEV